jgi:hypothetical protein
MESMNKDERQDKGLEPETKKISLAEMVKRKLEMNKAGIGAQGGRPAGHQPTGTKKMKSQMTKKVNNQKKRTGV